jgi:hypothetical protein
MLMSRKGTFEVSWARHKTRAIDQKPVAGCSIDGIYMVNRQGRDNGRDIAQAFWDRHRLRNGIASSPGSKVRADVDKVKMP